MDLGRRLFWGRRNVLGVGHDLKIGRECSGECSGE